MGTVFWRWRKLISESFVIWLRWRGVWKNYYYFTVDILCEEIPLSINNSSFRNMSKIYLIFYVILYSLWLVVWLGFLTASSRTIIFLPSVVLICHVSILGVKNMRQWLLRNKYHIFLILLYCATHALHQILGLMNQLGVNFLRYFFCLFFWVVRQSFFSLLLLSKEMTNY